MAKKKDINIPLPATTTEQEDMVTSGQRRINLIWEITQALVAIIITISVVYCIVIGTPHEELTNAFFLIVAMYFVRTNHTNVGGIGNKTGAGR